VSVEAATKTRTAYREYRRLQHRLRLGGEPELTGATVSRDKSQKFTRIAANHLSNDRMAVLQLWEEVFQL
jgi:glutamate-ammonia-ligase adenylyltransferase